MYDTSCSEHGKLGSYVWQNKRGKNVYVSTQTPPVIFKVIIVH